MVWIPPPVPRAARAALAAAFLAFSSGTLLAACTSDAARTASVAAVRARPCGLQAAAHPRIREVIWIWMENRSFDQAMAKPSMRTLAHDCGLATNYHNVTHGSLVNYLAATSGRLLPFRPACETWACPQTSSSLFEQLQSHHRSWRGYEEAMPGHCQLHASGSYAVRHNPAAYYVHVRPRCRTWDVPLGGVRSGAFAHDLATDHLPSFALVTPDLCDDMHSCHAAVGDAWLQDWLPRIFTSRAYRSGQAVVFLTWDEGEAAPPAPCQGPEDPRCHVAMLVMSTYTRPGTVSDRLFTHFSLLRTTELLLRLAPLGAAATAPDLRAPFGLGATG